MPDNKKAQLPAIAEGHRQIMGMDYEKDREADFYIAYASPASEEAVRDLLSMPPIGNDNRSPWVWLRLQNGDLVLATFPQGDTYEKWSHEAP